MVSPATESLDFFVLWTHFRPEVKLLGSLSFQHPEDSLRLSGDSVHLSTSMSTSGHIATMPRTASVSDCRTSSETESSQDALCSRLMQHSAMRQLWILQCSQLERPIFNWAIHNALRQASQTQAKAKPSRMRNRNQTKFAPVVRRACLHIPAFLVEANGVTLH